jgi:hypothetical protein
VEKSRHFDHLSIDGLSYWDGCVKLRKLKTGTELRPEHETDSIIAKYSSDADFPNSGNDFPRAGNEPVICTDYVTGKCEKKEIDGGDKVIDVGDQTIDVKDQNIDVGDQIIDVKDQNIDVGDQNMDVKDQIIDVGDQNIDVKDQIIDVKDQIIDVGKQICGFEIWKMKTCDLHKIY